MRNNLLLSKYFTIFLLIVSTIFDVGTTYATVKDKIYLDGNPIIRGLDWNEVIILQFIVLLFAIILYLISFRKHDTIWPNNHMNFMQFLKYCIKKQFGFSIKSINKDIIYSGLAIIWVLIVAHFIAGLLAALPLLGGTSILSTMSKIGFANYRYSQIAIIIILIVISVIIGHYPIYLYYIRSRKLAR
jgi:hypothetical protein